MSDDLDLLGGQATAQALSLEEAAAVLRAAGYSVAAPNAKRGEDRQTLWLCRWGTMTALVWAVSAENAELRVRRGVFKRAATMAEVEKARTIVNGPVHVIEASADDIRVFEEAGGVVPA